MTTKVATSKERVNVLIVDIFIELPFKQLNRLLDNHFGVEGPLFEVVEKYWIDVWNCKRK